MTSPHIYPGLSHEDNFGITLVGRLIRDAWVFDLAPEGSDFAGKSPGEMQNLFEKVHLAWEPYGQLPSRLPPELAQRHARIHGEAIAKAKADGWSAELGEDD
jgi:hypothetical protein